MKKNLLIILSLIILTATCQTYAKSNLSTELTDAIKIYKSGNYSECYYKLEQVIKSEPANALAYYYMAMTSATDSYASFKEAGASDRVAGIGASDPIIGGVKRKIQIWFSETHEL